MCVCVSFGVQNALASGTSVFERMCECGCGIVCCLPAGWAAVARVAMQCVGCFLPYIAMTGHVVSPVVAGGQQCNSLLAPLPLSKTRTQLLLVEIT